MKKQVMFRAAILLLSVVSASAHAQTTSAKPHKKPAHKAPPSIETQVRQMREDLQGQIDALKESLAAKESEIQAMQAVNRATQAQAGQTAAKVETIDSTLQQNVTVETGLKTSVDDLKLQTVAVVTSVQKVEKSQQSLESAVLTPASIHYKGITFTPGGFIAGESVWRQRAMNADIYTNFNATPFMNSGEAKTSEWVPSARGSRPNLLISGKVPFGTLNAFIETDFLSAGVTSNNNQTNSYTLRIRQGWGQAVVGGFKFTGGQMFTLLGENKKSTDAGQESFPMVFDGNLHVGFTYLRQPGFRIQDTIRPGLTVAMSLESAQYLFSASNAPSNFFFGSAGAVAGIENSTANYSNQVAPDVIVKVALDPGHGHYELGGVARFFRDRYYPGAAAAPATAAGAQNDTRFGGGFVANAKFPVTSKLDLGAHLVAGDGTGRYGASLLPDVTVRPNGTLALIRNAQGLASVEIHPNKRLDLFAYAGTEYVQRTYKVGTAGALVGYAPPNANNNGCNTEAVPTGSTGYLPGVTATCAGVTRVLIEGSAGWAYRIYSGPAGRLQYGAAYSYLTRGSWAGLNGNSPKATNNMVFTSFRYFLP